MENVSSSFAAFAGHYVSESKRALDLLDMRRVAEAALLIQSAYENDRTVFIIGNGGSASTASHMACDLGKGTLARIYDAEEKRLKVVSLTDNVATLTAYGNDLSFDDIFVQQLQNLVQSGDVVIALSGSGNSPNVVKAVTYARQRGAKTIGMLGFGNGGKLAWLVDCPIVIQSNHYGPIEDIHLALGHMITAWIAHAKTVHRSSELLLTENGATPFRISFSTEHSVEDA